MTKTYNHMARDKNAVGTVLKGKGKKMVAPSIEDLLEEHRSKSSPSRLDSVYMTEDRDFYRQGISAENGYVHQIEPIGPTERRDNKWIGELEWNHDETQRTLARWLDWNRTATTPPFLRAINAHQFRRSARSRSQLLVHFSAPSGTDAALILATFASLRHALLFQNRTSARHV